MRTPDVPSPYGLIQERVLQGDDLDGWRVLVACVACNVSRGKAAVHAIEDAFAAHPTPEAMAKADDLADLLHSTGLQNRKAHAIRTISAAFATDTPVQDIPFVGRYALEAHEIFALRRLPPTEPKDGVLALYWRWATGRDRARA